MNTVDQIYARNSLRAEIPYKRTRGPISLHENLMRFKSSGKTGIISEFKRRSPSGFDLKKNVDPIAYFNNSNLENVAGISILTEPDFFNGSYSDITSVQSLNIPILDKDFASTETMVENAYNSGADVILFILDFLEPKKVEELSAYAITLGLEALVEFHDIALMKHLKPRKGVIYGYNRRNLRTLKMEPMEQEVMEYMKNRKTDIILESGIDQSYLQVHDVSQYLGMLIGTSILNGEILNSDQGKP